MNRGRNNKQKAKGEKGFNFRIRSKSSSSMQEAEWDRMRKLYWMIKCKVRFLDKEEKKVNRGKEEELRQRKLRS